MACARCGKKASDATIPRQTGAPAERPRPRLRQRTVQREVDPRRRFIQQPGPITPADQPQR